MHQLQSLPTKFMDHCSKADFSNWPKILSWLGIINFLICHNAPFPLSVFHAWLQLSQLAETLKGSDPLTALSKDILHHLFPFITQQNYSKLQITANKLLLVINLTFLTGIINKNEPLNWRGEKLENKNSWVMCLQCLFLCMIFQMHLYFFSRFPK